MKAKLKQKHLAGNVIFLRKAARKFGEPTINAICSIIIGTKFIPRLQKYERLLTLTDHLED